MRSLPSRIGAFFVEPPAQGETSRAGDLMAAGTQPRPLGGPPASGGELRTASSADAGDVAPAMSAAVLGAPGAVIPVAAACAGELRARGRAAAALVCTWRPGGAGAGPPGPQPDAWGGAATAPVLDAVGDVPSGAGTSSPAGATTPAARRLAARLSAHGLPATACGRLAWVSLEPAAEAAAAQARRALAITDVPVVLAVAGPRPAALEPLLAELDVAVAVLAPDAEPALRELALRSLATPRRIVLPPLAPGPQRWAAMAGLARLRSLPEAA